MVKVRRMLEGNIDWPVVKVASCLEKGEIVSETLMFEYIHNDNEVRVRMLGLGCGSGS